MNPFVCWRRLGAFLLLGATLAMVLAIGLRPELAHAQPPMPPAPPATAAAPSVPAQRIYAQAQQQLVQVRTLLQGNSSQATVGSGFLIGAGGLLMTNYHVISTVALEPERYRLVYTKADGQEGPLELVAFNVVHDLALVRAAPPAFAHVAPLAFRPPDAPLQHGERLFSLGNPLDVGFAVMEGHYNGLVERSFYPNIFFGGSLSSGMSGGPALDAQGRVIGINVATRRDGEQISFLVPAAYGQALLQAPMPVLGHSDGGAYAEITRQLLVHQQVLTERFLSLPWQATAQTGYVFPMPQEAFMRCWGQSAGSDGQGMRARSTNCSMDAPIFVSERQLIGGIQVRHRWLDGSRLGRWRFAQQYAALFDDQLGSPRSRRDERPPRRCHEQFIEPGGLPMRAVVCVDAFRKLKGLYALEVLTASVNEETQGLQSRLRVSGVSFDNAMRLAEHFLEGFAWRP